MKTTSTGDVALLADKFVDDNTDAVTGNLFVDKAL